MSISNLTENVIRTTATDKSFQRGRELYRGGAISNTAIQGSVLSGDCEGNESPFYRVRAELDSGGIRLATCTCPYDFGGYCKHIVALLLSYAHAPGQFVTRKEPSELLADLDREQLLALMTKLLCEQPDLYDWVEAAIGLPIARGKGRPVKDKRNKLDVSVYSRRVRNIMHGLDHMRASDAYWHVGGLVGELDGVRKTAMEFLNASDAEAALEIMLALVKESHDGFEYIDDSNGELGDFLSGVGETLAEVILSLDLNEEKREDLHDKLSDYGIDGLSVAIAAATYGWGEAPREESSRRDEEDEDEDEWDDEDELLYEADGYDPFASPWVHEDPVQEVLGDNLLLPDRPVPGGDYFPRERLAGYLYPNQGEPVARVSGLPYYEGFSFYDVSTARKIRVVGFYLTIKVEDFKLNAADSQKLDSMLVGLHFQNAPERRPLSDCVKTQ
jgi:hypothetical protein